MSAFRIEPAREQDVGEILRLIRALADYEKARSEEVPVDEERLRQALFGPHPRAEALIGWLDGGAVALALFFHNFSTWQGRPGLYLEDLFVEPEMRGRGFGKALLAELAGIARRRDCARMEWAVLDWNRPAIDFYQGLGARPLNEWTIFRMTGEAIDRLAESK